MTSLNNKIARFDKAMVNKLPSLSEASIFIESLLDYLFPVRAKYRSIVEVGELKERILVTQLSKLLGQIFSPSDEKINKITADFFYDVNIVFDDLVLDAETSLKADPAAKSIEEVIVAYPGFYAIAIYRISNLFYKYDIPYLPRILSEYAHSKTGIDIHPGADIGKSFFIDHGTGVVIGETTVIGNEVKIYQGVTLGALQVSRELANSKRHPTIEDRVVIYSGTTILGGETIVGHDTIVGGNVWLTKSVPAFSAVFSSHQIKVRQQEYLSQEINFVI